MPFSPPSANRVKPANAHAKRDWRRQLKYYYYCFVRLQGTPHEMARGLASGVFAGCYPLFGLQTIIGLAIATVLRGNRILAAAGTWISNPVTDLPIVAFNYQVGHWIIGGNAPNLQELNSIESWLATGTEVTTRLMLGSTLVGLVSSVLSYYGGIWLIHHLRHRRDHYRARRAKRLQTR